MPVYYYQAQERAFAPGSAGEWPAVIEKPDNRNGRLVRCDLQELLIAAASELFSIANGVAASDKSELLRISDGLRQIYEGAGLQPRGRERPHQGDVSEEKRLD